MHINEYMPRQLIVTFITIMFFFYPNVVQSIMTIFSCVSVDEYTSNELAVGSWALSASCVKPAPLPCARQLAMPFAFSSCMAFPQHYPQTGLGLQTDPVWSQDFGQVCYKGAHLGLALGLGVPSIILIAIGWPLMSALLVAGKISCLTNIRFTEDMTEMFLADFKAK